MITSAFNKSWMKHALLVALLIMSISSCTSVPEGIKPVGGFELERYLGTWYEIGRYEHSFEDGLNNISATYTLRDDGGINVVNRGLEIATGKWRQADGKAYPVSSADIGHLKVSFFGPFYASYVIMALDKENYQYALVTGPNRDYFWILARQPQLPDETLSALLSIARGKGFTTENIIWVEHDKTQS